MKNSLVGVLSCVAFAAAAETLYPVYTVTTAGEATATNALEACAVSVVAAEGAEPTETTFAALDKSLGKFSGTFVMRPTGYLQGTPAMTNFTGVIRIETGAYISTGAGCLGPMVGNKAPKLWVLDGASLVNAAQKARPDGCVYNELHLAGAGHENIGAYCHALAIGHNDYCFYNYLYLEADTDFGFATNTRCDFGGDYCRKLYLQDHVLTVRKATPSSPSGGYFCTYATGLVAGGDHGRLIVKDGCVLYPQSTPVWEGGAANRIVIEDPSFMGYFNALPVMPWTLVWNSSATFTVNEGSSGGVNTSPSGWNATANTDRNAYRGSIEIGQYGLLLRATTAGGNHGARLQGDISGSGGLFGRDLVLELSGSNSWQGASCAKRTLDGYESGFGFHGAKSMPGDCAQLTFSNAFCRLVESRFAHGRDSWNLPPVAFHVGAGEKQALAIYETTNSVADGGVHCDLGGLTGTLASLRKTGAGELVVEPALAITGVTEVLEGTLRLGKAATYSAAPGLWEGNLDADPAQRAEWYRVYTLPKDDPEKVATTDLPCYKFYVSSECITNRISGDLTYSRVYGWPWHNFEVVTYTGYLWNRNATNETWTFVGSVYDACRLFLNGSQVFTIYDGGNLGVRNATVKPGPNPFMFRMYLNSSNSGGGMSPTGNWPLWNKRGYGFAFARTKLSTVAGEADLNDYLVPTNGAAACPGGDGFYFTRDTRAPEDFSAEELAATRTTISNLVMRKEGTLDLAGSPLFVETLTGFGTVTNGSLTVKGAWTLTDEDLESGGTLEVDGALTFTSETPFVFDGLDTLDRSLSGDEVTLVRAKGGIVGTPRYEPAPGSSKARKWHLSSATQPDGSATLTFAYSAGTMLILR